MSTPSRTPLKISYAAYQKHKDRNDDTWFCRVRERGVSALDINLHTKVKAQADAYVMLRRSELQLYNAKVLTGEATEEDLRKLVRRNSPVIAQKGTSEAVLALRVCLDAWEAELRRCGRREKTVAAYMRALKVIAPSGALLVDMTEDNMRKWLAAFDHLKANTRKFYSVALREFTKFCCKEYKLDRNLVDSFNFVKVQHVDRPHWTMQQMAHVINSVECRDKVQEKVYKAYYWVMATCGSRQGETYELLWSDLKFSDPVSACLTFRAENTKNNQTRIVPLDWRISRLLSRLPHEGPRMFQCLPRSQAARYRVLTKAVEKSGEPKGNLHTFRHSVSYVLYKSSEDIKATAQLLGHSPQTSLFYYQASRQEEQLREVVDKAYEGETMMPSPIDELIDADLW